MAVESQQIVEKILRGLTEICDSVPVNDKEYLLKMHNLRKLGKVVNFAILRKFRRIKFSLFKRFLFRGQISRGSS